MQAKPKPQVMKNRIILFLAMFLCCVFMAHSQGLNSVFKRLDEIIDNRPTYIAKKETALKEMRTKASYASGKEKFDLYVDLFNEYRVFRADSALHYGEMCEQLAIAHNDQEELQCSQILKAVGLGILGMYNEAHALLDSLGKIYPSNQVLYYTTMTDIISWQSEFVSNKDVKLMYRNQSSLYRDSLIAATENELFKNHNKSISLMGKDNAQAKTIALSTLQSLPEGHDSIRYITNELALIYSLEEKRDSSEYYYALSAISDMECGVREHSSLINLTIMLYEDGDIDRAYKYMNQCFADASECIATLRTLEMSQKMPQILEAYHKKIRNNQRVLFFISIIILILAFVIAMDWLRIHRYSRKLRAAQKDILGMNENLKKANEKLAWSLQKEKQVRLKLEESNRIKDTYLANYMRDCSCFIDKLDNYRKSLQQLAMRNNTEKLFDAIRSTDFIDKEIDNFYKGFDETFLSVFPTFVEEFNLLLKPEGRIIPSGPKRLTTELRIFALIRLGITDSNDIASFLRHSVKTIYNYRTKMRNMSLGNRNELEEKLKEIGVETEEANS